MRGSYMGLDSMRRLDGHRCRQVGSGPGNAPGGGKDFACAVGGAGAVYRRLFLKWGHKLSYFSAPMGENAVEALIESYYIGSLAMCLAEPAGVYKPAVGLVRKYFA